MKFTKKRASITKPTKTQINQAITPPITIPFWHQWIPASILAILTAIVYYPSRHYAFQFDDLANINHHFQIRHHTLRELFFSGTRWISYWLNSIHYKIGKFDPFSYRLANIFLHTLNGVLLFFIFLYALSHLKKQSFFKDNALVLSFLTALLFLLHPVQTQTVSYVIQGQLEGLSAFFILSMSLSLILFAQATSNFFKYSTLLLLLTLAFLSCGSKEIAIISPLLLLLLDWFLIAQGETRLLKNRIWLHTLNTLIIFAGYMYLLKPEFFTKILSFGHIANNNIGNVITQNPGEIITPWLFFISQFKVILHYLWIFIWPFNISVEYDWTLVKGLFALDCILPLFALMCLALFVYQLLKKDKTNLFAFGLIWFAICIAPRSSIIPSPELLVDYKTYTASVGWLFILAITLIWCMQKIQVNKLRPLLTVHPEPVEGRRTMSIIFPLLLALPLGLATTNRNTVWSSGLEFWGNILQNAPGKARAYNNYGFELSQHLQQFKESIPYFQKAIELDARYPDPCNNLAVAYANTGEIELAIATLQKSLAINPNYPEGYNNLASFYLRIQNYEKAESMLRVALKLRPHYGKAYFNLGRIYLEKGDKYAAWQQFKNSCTIADLDNEVGFLTYAQVSLTIQKFDDARLGYQKVLEFNPNNPDALFGLANTFFSIQEYDKAEQLFKQVLALQPDHLNANYNLGETYFITNKWEQALVCFQAIIAHKSQLPQIYVRIANCYEKMDNPQAAQAMLCEMLREQLPVDLKNSAKAVLARLEAKHSLKPVIPV